MRHIHGGECAALNLAKPGGLRPCGWQLTNREKTGLGRAALTTTSLLRAIGLGWIPMAGACNKQLGFTGAFGRANVCGFKRARKRALSQWVAPLAQWKVRFQATDSAVSSGTRGEGGERILTPPPSQEPEAAGWHLSRRCVTECSRSCGCMWTATCSASSFNHFGLVARLIG